MLEYKLENGIEVYLQKMEGVRSVSLGLAVKAGSSDEAKGFEGIAHCTEHMVFKGTRSRNALELKEPIEKVGGMLNAFTGKENTVFFARVPDNSAETGLEILKDLCTGASFPEDQFQLEKEVILEEINASEDDPVDMVYENFFKTIWKDCTYGNPVLGSEDSVNSLQKQNLLDFYDFQYNSANMVLSIAGNYKESLLENLVSLKPGKKNINKPEISFSANHEPFIEERQDIQQIHFLTGIKAPSRIEKEFEVFQVLNTVLSDGMSSRLFHRIREELGLVYSIDTGLAAYPKGGVFYLYAATSTDKFPLLFDELKKQINGLLENGISEKELSFGKERLLGKLLLSTESTYSSMMRNLDTGLAFGKPSTVEEMEERIRKITSNDILKLTEHYFDSQWTCSMIIPQKSNSSLKCCKLIEKEFKV